MSDVFIGEKGKYDWTWDLSSLVYLPKYDAVLVTRYLARALDCKMRPQRFFMPSFSSGI
jgi:hypothetical protein